MALNHDHPKGQCPEPEPPTGWGQCVTCRYADANYVTKDDLIEQMKAATLSYEKRRAIQLIIEG
jgi:hypothetical protein